MSDLLTSPLNLRNFLWRWWAAVHFKEELVVPHWVIPEHLAAFKYLLMVVILSSVRESVMPDVWIVLLFFWHVEFRGCYGRRKPKWAKCQLSHSDEQRGAQCWPEPARTKAVEPSAPRRHTSYLGGLSVNQIMSMLSSSRNNVTKCHCGMESRGAPL